MMSQAQVPQKQVPNIIKQHPQCKPTMPCTHAQTHARHGLPVTKMHRSIPPNIGPVELHNSAAIVPSIICNENVFFGYIFRKCFFLNNDSTFISWWNYPLFEAPGVFTHTKKK